MTATEYKTIFDWSTPRSRRLLLASFIGASIVLHAFCFYVFQIVYPTPIALLPPPARVTFIAPDSEEGRTLLRWIDAEDPAVAFTTHPAPGARLGALPKTEHLPSYSAVEPILKELPSLKADLSIPSSQPPGAVHFMTRARDFTKGTPRTYISFSKELNEFGTPTLLPRADFATLNQETPETLRFRVAVNDLGEIRYCFPINSSGDAALDEQARLQVVRTRFSPIRQNDTPPSASLVWGTASVQWASDVESSQRPSTANLNP